VGLRRKKKKAKKKAALLKNVIKTTVSALGGKIKNQSTHRKIEFSKRRQGAMKEGKKEWTQLSTKERGKNRSGSGGHPYGNQMGLFEH